MGYTTQLSKDGRKGKTERRESQISMTNMDTAISPRGYVAQV